MKKVKKLKILLFAGLGLVILCSVALPALLAHFSEKSLLNDVGMFDDTLTPPNTTPDIETKLALISKHALGSGNITLTEQKNIISSGGENAVLSAAIAELKKLANLGLVPSISPDASASGLSCSAATYTNSEDPSSRVTLWKMNFSADGYDISLWMDAHTHKIFCVSFENTAFSLPETNTQSICEAWGNYLGVESDIAFSSESGFSAAFGESVFIFSSYSNGVSVAIATSGF
ncbi:MAG: hypothetical protein IKM29_04225 [Clostridia bacterium]|nr:hypothetical protein [Clostridia bacterium]